MSDNKSKMPTWKIIKSWMIGLQIHPSMLLSWIIISVATLGTFFVYKRIQPTLDRSKIYPAKSERFDVTSIEIAASEVFCKKPVASKRAFEECLKSEDLNHSSLESLSIPSIDDILEKSPPRFVSLLEKQGLEEVAANIKNGFPYVIKFELPSRLFSEMKLAENRNILVFHGLLSAIVCIDNLCTQEINRYEFENKGIKLVSDKPMKNADELKTVYVLAKDKPFTVGLSLLSGVFISSQKNLQQIYRNGPIIKGGKSLVFNAIFAGLLLAAFIYCLASGFLDYAALSFLAFSMSLFIVGEQDSLFPDIDTISFYQQRAFINLNLLIAATIFAASTLRLKWKWYAFTLPFVYGLAWLISYKLLPVDQRALVSEWPQYSLIAANYLFWVPPGICFAGAVNCFLLAIEAKKAKKGRSEISDLLRRGILEQVVFGVALGFFGYHSLQMAFLRKSGLESERFLPASAIVFFILFAVMVINSLIRHKLAIQNTSDLSESEKVRLRLGKKGLAKFYAKKRWGVFVNIDLKGSTLAATTIGSQMHDIMSELGETIYLSHKKEGRQWIHDNIIGDEWIVALKPIFEDPKDELDDAIRITNKYMDKYLGVVKHFEDTFDVKLSLHINIMGVSNYSLGAANKKSYDTSPLLELKEAIDGKYKSDSIFRRKADFLGPEINFMMKYVGKPPSRHFAVSGNESFFGEEALDGVTKKGKITDLMLAKNADEKTVLAARSLDLKYMFMNWDDLDAKYKEVFNKRNKKNAAA